MPLAKSMVDSEPKAFRQGMSGKSVKDSAIRYTLHLQENIVHLHIYIYVTRNSLFILYLTP